MTKTKDYPFLETIDLKKSDIRWACNAIGGRHTGGYKAWWKQNAGRISMEGFIQAVLSVWEACRSKAHRLPLSKEQKKLRGRLSSEKRTV